MKNASTLNAQRPSGETVCAKPQPKALCIMRNNRWHNQQHMADQDSKPAATCQRAGLLVRLSKLLDKRGADQQRAFVRAGAGLPCDVAGSQP